MRTIKQELLIARHFSSREERRRHLYAYVRWYNHVRRHEALGNVSPISYLESYITRTKQALQSLTLRPESVTNA